MHWQTLQLLELLSPHIRKFSKLWARFKLKPGEIPILDDALKELLNNYKKKSKK